MQLRSDSFRDMQPIPEAQLLPFPFHHVEIARIASRDSYIGFDPELGWSQTPGARAIDDGIVFEANEAGFRAERDYPREPPPGVSRLAAFGDSFTHCDEVGLQDCWTTRLAGAWEGAEVLNFGIPGSAPDQGWLRYQRDGKPYRPCAVLIGPPFARQSAATILLDKRQTRLAVVCDCPQNLGSALLYPRSCYYRHDRDPYRTQPAAAVEHGEFRKRKRQTVDQGRLLVRRE